MRINNGVRHSLVIADVYSGMCGISRGRLAFLPSAPIALPTAVQATLGGKLALLTDVRQEPDGRSWSARFKVFGE